MRNKTIGLAVLVLSILVLVNIGVTAFMIGEFDTQPSQEEQIHTEGVSSETVTELRNNTVTIYETSDLGESQGSGFYTQDGLIVTNAHVSNNADSLYIQTGSGEVMTATVRGEDSFTDLSVLEPEYTPDNAEGLSFSESFSVGEPVVVMGSPDGLRNSVTTGIVSGVDRSVPSRVENYTIPSMIQVDAALNPGNSGGPIVNSDNQVVGVAQSTTGENLGFGVSSEITSKVYTSLKNDGEHNHPYIGIQSLDTTPTIAEEASVDIFSGVLITEVMEDGPADQGTDIRPYQINEETGEFEESGMKLTHIDDHKVRSNTELSRVLLVNYQAGDEVEMRFVDSEGAVVTETITLGERP